MFFFLLSLAGVVFVFFLILFGGMVGLGGGFCWISSRTKQKPIEKSGSNFIDCTGRVGNWFGIRQRSCSFFCAVGAALSTDVSGARERKSIRMVPI